MRSLHAIHRKWKIHDGGEETIVVLNHLVCVDRNHSWVFSSIYIHQTSFRKKFFVATKLTEPVSVRLEIMRGSNEIKYRLFASG